MLKQTSRRGPRQDRERLKEAILDAAREEFGKNGYKGATMRGIARAAGVDASLIAYYFGSKDRLFVESLRLPVNPGDAIDGLLQGSHDDLGERFVRRLLAVWDEPATGGPLLNVVRSAAGEADMLREFMEGQILARLIPAIAGPDAELRAAAVATQVFGLVFLRYVLRVEPLASADHDAVAALFGPTLQRYVVDGQPR